MSVYVAINGMEGQAFRDLKKVTGPTSDMAVDLVPITTTGLDGGTLTTVPSGKVFFRNVWPSNPPVGYGVLRAMVENVSFHLEIRAETTAYRYHPTDATKTLLGAAGVTTRPDVRNGLTMVRIAYDATGCGTGVGRPGYVVRDQMDKDIDNPVDVYLFHELAHAFHHMKADFKPASPEVQAIAEHPGENDYRVWRGLPARNTGTNIHKGLPNCLLGTKVTPPTCFPASTPVLTPRGYVPISALQAGSTILSYDVKSASVRERAVSKVVAHPAGEIWRVVTDTSEEIEVTGDHSFLTKRGWVRTRKLRAGDQLVAEPSGEKRIRRRVAAILNTGRIEPVYNLYTVGDHNFLAHGCVVHNFTRFRTMVSWYHRFFIDPFVGESCNAWRAVDASFGDATEGSVPFDPQQWFYTVTITNATDTSPLGPASLDLVLFYKRKNKAGVVFREFVNLLPGQRYVFALCPCNELESYAFGAFTLIEVNGQLQQEMVASLPVDLANDPPITPATKQDQQPCEDSWTIGK
jgi:hypothetical protein